MDGPWHDCGLLEKGMILAHLCDLMITDVVVFLQKYDQLFAVSKERQEGDEHTAETEEIPLGGTADSLVQIPWVFVGMWYIRKGAFAVMVDCVCLSPKDGRECSKNAHIG